MTTLMRDLTLAEQSAHIDALTDDQPGMHATITVPCQWCDGYGATDTDDWCQECAGTGEQACSCGAWGYADDACQAHPCGDGSPYPLDLRGPLPDLLPGLDLWADRQPTEPPW